MGVGRTSLRAMDASTSSPPPRTFFLASLKGTASGPDLWKDGMWTSGSTARRGTRGFEGRYFPRDADGRDAETLTGDVPAHLREKLAVHHLVHLLGAPMHRDEV